MTDRDPAEIADETAVEGAGSADAHADSPNARRLAPSGTPDCGCGLGSMCSARLTPRQLKASGGGGLGGGGGCGDNYGDGYGGGDGEEEEEGGGEGDGPGFWGPKGVRRLTLGEGEHCVLHMEIGADAPGNALHETQILTQVAALLTMLSHSEASHIPICLLWAAITTHIDVTHGDAASRKALHRLVDNIFDGILACGQAAAADKIGPCAGRA